MMYNVSLYDIGALQGVAPYDVQYVTEGWWGSLMYDVNEEKQRCMMFDVSDKRQHCMMYDVTDERRHRLTYNVAVG